LRGGSVLVSKNFTASGGILNTHLELAEADPEMRTGGLVGTEAVPS
jgi:hypothetical protein